MYPRARQHGLLVDRVGDETIVFDEERKEAHSLNRMASIVWQHCDGAHSLSQIAAVLTKELRVEANETIVLYALDKLAGVHLLEDDDTTAVDRPTTRRDVMKRVAAVGVAAVGLPAVLTMTAPTPAMAASGGGILPPDPGPD
jgi:Coenzyme PQQ synthesis protein D (PqqD)